MNESLQAMVGKRIAQERNTLGLTQSVLAERISITKARLANYEDGRGCLRCKIAFDLCRSLVLSERWLATGEGNKDLYLNVALCFPAELMGSPFLEMYDSHIKGIYEQKMENTKGELHFGWRNADHPETLKLACFKYAGIHSKGITDTLSLMFYWADLARQAIALGDKYSIPPRERKNMMNDKITLLKNGKVIPFSYEQFFDDLALTGLAWLDIESIADEITDRFNTDKKPIPIDQLKNLIYSHLQNIDQSDGASISKLYWKIYLKEK